jgi:hypothetical protein
VGLTAFTSVIYFPAKMSAKHCTEATPTDFDDFWNNTMELSGGLTPREDSAIKPNYYVKNGLECYDAQLASVGLSKFQGYLECCIYKYLWRWEDKNGKQDLEKAAEYLAKLIETLE